MIENETQLFRLATFLCEIWFQKIKHKPSCFKSGWPHHPPLAVRFQYFSIRSMEIIY